MSDSINISKSQASLMYSVLEKQVKEKEATASQLLAEIKSDKALMEQLSKLISDKPILTKATVLSYKKDAPTYNVEWALLEKIDYTLKIESKFMTAGEIATFIYNIDSSYPNFNDLKATVASTLSPYAKAKKRYQRIKEDESSAYKYGLIDWEAPLF